MLRNSIGYLRILGFEGYTKNGSFEQGAIALESALDDIFKDAARIKGLIIDVRVNTGGADPLCLAIASRLSGARVPRLLKGDAKQQSGRTAPFYSAAAGVG